MILVHLKVLCLLDSVRVSFKSIDFGYPSLDLL